MKRRSSSGDKSRRHKAATLKGSNAPKAERGPSAASQETEVARVIRERDEALLREAANSEILNLISRSPGDLEPVFQAILENATRICDAKFGVLDLAEGDCFRRTAHYNTPLAFLELLSREPVFRPGPRTALARVAATKQPVHIADIAAEQLYAERDPLRVGGVEVLGMRTLVVVPMLKGAELIGGISIYRQEVHPFTDKQIELVKNFAAQAVIAIENTRLLNELRESLERQTATSEVLRVISSSPGELEPVFQAMLKNAVRICEAKFGVLYLYEAGKFRPSALENASPEFEAYLKERGPFVPHPDQPFSKLLKTKAVIHTSDYTVEGPPPASFKFGGARAHISVPMLKEDEVIGAIIIFRQEARPFTDRQVALVSNFAAQAVIAIENTRLLNELREFVAAADCDCRRAQSHQPLDIRSSDGAHDANQIGHPALRG